VKLRLREAMLTVWDGVRTLFSPPESDERRAYYNLPHDEPNAWLAEGESLVKPEEYAKKDEPSRE